MTSQVDCLWHSVVVTDHQVYQLLNTISSRQHTAYMSKYHEKYAVFSPVICCILVLLESYRANLQGIFLMHRNCNLIFVLGNSELEYFSKIHFSLSAAKEGCKMAMWGLQYRCW